LGGKVFFSLLDGFARLPQGTVDDRAAKYVTMKRLKACIYAPRD